MNENNNSINRDIKLNKIEEERQCSKSQKFENCYFWAYAGIVNGSASESKTIKAPLQPKNLIASIYVHIKIKRHIHNKSGDTTE